VAFGPHSSTILTVDDANNIRIWDTCTDCQDTAALMALAKTHATRQLTPIERHLYHVS
jgi:hypothetical protein